MKIRITQLDGKLPNLALMRLSHHHRALGHDVYFTRSPYRHLGEPDYDTVYGSAIFDYSRPHADRLRAEFPGAIIGGTASRSVQTVEDIIGPGEGHSYADYPDFTASLGFTQRGCRLSCKFCVVPQKEGKPRSVATISQIWRGPGFPKHIHLLDNDFFGQPEPQWRALIDEIVDGGFKTKRLYTAWDNLKDEDVFFRGVDLLETAGVRPSNLMAYMLIGFDKRETWERLFHRFNRMVARGIRPYPMVYGDRHRTIPLGGHNARIGHRTMSDFQRWVIRKAYTFIPFENYDVNARGHAEPQTGDLFATAD